MYLLQFEQFYYVIIYLRILYQVIYYRFIDYFKI